MDYELTKVPTNPRCSDHPMKSERAIIIKYPRSKAVVFLHPRRVFKQLT